MHITFGGVIFLLGIVVVIFGIIWFKAWRSGKSLNVKSLSLNRQSKNPDIVLCLNVYPDCIRGEGMMKKSIHPEARTWSFGMKKYVLQQCPDKEYLPLQLPTEIHYLPEWLAGMMGAEPVRSLLSLKFSLLEKLAPFAPVAALGIVALLFIIVM